jgi:beta-1,2-rhamnosyltransferase WsaF-like protein
MVAIARTLRSFGRFRALTRGIRGFILGVPVAPPPRSRQPAAPPPAKPDYTIHELIRIQPSPSAMASPRLNLLIPTLSAAATYGGVRTAIDLFDALTGPEVAVRIISLAPLDSNVTDALPGSVVVRPGEDSTERRQVVTIAPDRDGASIPVGPHDMFVATFWPTADFVLRVRRWQEATYGSPAPRFVYLIQDFEPGFYPWSAPHLLARATYDEPGATIAVFNSSLLRDYFHASHIRFADEHVFEPKLAAALRVIRDRPPLPRDQRIVVYGRPRTPRNGFSLIVEGLRSWHGQHPGAAEWSVVSAGQEHEPIDLGGGGRLRSIGKLDITLYGDLLKRSAVGLSLMISPHPSYPPLEMAHLGMLVLTNGFGGKDLATWHGNVVSLDGLTADGIGEALAGLCRRFELDPLVGELGVALRPDFLRLAPEFPFVAEVLAALQLGGG